MAADDRDRRAQLVADVADEVALVRKRDRQPIEHAVESAPEVGELVVALDLDPPRHVGAGDRPRAVAQAAQRPEHATGGKEGDRRADEQHARGHGADDPHRLVDLLALARRVVGDHERPQGPAPASTGTARYSAGPIAVSSSPRSLESSWRQRATSSGGGAKSPTRSLLRNAPGRGAGS